MAIVFPGAVAFDYTLFNATYPEFASVSEDQIETYWGQAGLYLDNSASSKVIDNAPGGQRAILLNMLTAHITKLFAVIDGQPSPQTVGRISQASQGSVSASFDYGTQPGTDVWYNQTKYGAQYLAAIAGYRSGGRYKPGPQPYLGVGGPWGFGWAGGRSLR